MKTLIATVWVGIAIGGMVLLGRARAQTLLDLKAQGKNIDFSGSPSTRPVKTGTVLPATCQTGELFFKSNATGGQNLFGCVTADAWFQLSGGSTQVAAGTVGGIIVTTANNTAYVDSDTTFLMTAGGHNAPAGNMTPSAGIWNLTSVDGLIARNGSTDPATCAIGELFVNTTGTPALKLCTVVNSWNATGGGGSTMGQMRTLKTGQSSASCPSGQTALASYTIPANTLEAGDVVDVRAFWKKTGTNNTGQMRVFFGATQIGGTAAIGAAETFAFTEASIFMAGTSSQRSVTHTLRENSSTTAVAVNSVSESVSGGIVVSLTGEACTSGDTLSVDWFDIAVKKNAN